VIPFSWAQEPAEFAALGFNPAPGSVRAVDDAVAALERVLRRLDHVGQLLVAPSADGSWSDTAANACAARIEDLKKKLPRRREAVEAVCQALSGWSVTLSSNHQLAHRYELEAEAAQKAAEAARASPIFTMAAVSIDWARSTEGRQRLAEAQQAVSEAEAQLAAVRAKANKLEGDHGRAADAVARAIRRTEPLLEVPFGKQPLGHPAFLASALSALTLWSGRDQGDVPAPSSWPRPDAGSGRWGAKAPTAADWLTYAKWDAVQLVADAEGRTNAARHMRHYLNNTGEPLDVDPGRMMRDLPRFRKAVEYDLSRHDAEWRRQALEYFERSGGRPFQIPVETDWHAGSSAQSDDWSYALGEFWYKETGVIEVIPSRDGGEPQITMRYQVHVYDTYNWDQGKAVQIDGHLVKDSELGRLHHVGLAHEYEMRGHTDTMTRSVGDGSGPSPSITPPTGERDGTRADPAR